MIISYIALGIVIDIILTMISKRKKLVFRVGKIHLHHSIYGLLLLIIGFYISVNALIWVGIGIILGHSIRNKGLLFVDVGKMKIF